MEELYWADQMARKIVEKYPKKKVYTIRAGLASSGIIHAGKFREVITVHLVDQAFKSLGKKTRFICYFDDYDRFRKVPANVPAEWEKYIGMPLVDVPDPWGCHKSYAEHFEKIFMDEMKLLGIAPEYLFESINYRKMVYKDEIKIALLKREELKAALNKFRQEVLEEDWYPTEIYCDVCKKDFTKITSYDGKYTVHYECECGHKEVLDFSKKGNIKLKWRIETPMKWKFYDVLFEPWGKDHISPGGTFDTGKEMTKTVFPCDPPEYVAYNQIKLKGQDVKMSSSKGNVLMVSDLLKVYLPEILKYLYAGTKPNKEFNMPVDDDIIKTYDDFYLAERIYFGKENVSERNKMHWSRVYEMSTIPEKNLPIQPNFRQCMELINIYRTPENAIKTLDVTKSDKARYLAILNCAKNWMELYGRQHLFNLVERPTAQLDEKQIKIIKEFEKKLEGNMTEEKLVKVFSDISEENGIEIKEFYRIVYSVLFGKERGPRLAPFILSMGKEKIQKILKHY